MRQSVIRFSIVFSLLVVCLAAVQAQPKRLTVNDVFNLETVADPQISPDGKRIVYVRNFTDIMTDRRVSNLWIINTDGTDHRPLTTGNYNDTAPRWSPDGSQLIYLSNREGATQIYRRWMDTGQVAKLTGVTQPIANPANKKNKTVVAILVSER